MPSYSFSFSIGLSLCRIEVSLAVAMFGYRPLRVIYNQSHLDSDFFRVNLLVCTVQLI